MSNKICNYTCSCGNLITKKKRLNPGSVPRCDGCINRDTRSRNRVRYSARGGKSVSQRAAERNRRLLRNYGITSDQYDCMLEKQGNACASCRKSEETVGKLVVDHCHQTGKVRGLLCQNCNRVLGSVYEDFTVMRGLSAYLMHHDPLRSWDSYFVEFARLASTRSKDPSSKVGAVIVKERRILATGYNGLPKGVNDAIPERWERPLKYDLVIHAEVNAILNANKDGTSMEGATIYVTPFSPCMRCAGSIIQVGIREVVVDDIVYNPRYEEEFTRVKSWFAQAGVILRKPE